MLDMSQQYDFESVDAFVHKNQSAFFEINIHKITLRYTAFIV